jgi:bisanhydrobacterioruberin hydratase
MDLFSKKNIAIAIALLFHICGAIGILFSPYKNWFVANTSLNLVIMVCLLCFTQESKLNTPIYKEYKSLIGFIAFALIAFVVGFVVEVVGVNTGVLFGNYRYGNVMGIKLLNVPLLIGIQWFVTVYCCGVIMNYVNNWAHQKTLKEGESEVAVQKIKSISLIIDAALLATLFDYIIEPVAQKLNYWHWQNGVVPYFNYTCWFFISALLLLVLNKFSFNKLNPFAIHLFIIQVLFFIALRIYL